MDEQRKKQELERVCERAYNRDVKNLLWKLGEKTIPDAAFCASASEIGILCFEKADSKRVTQALHNARAFLQEYYANTSSEDHVCIDLPRGNEKRGMDRSRGRISMTFLDDPEGKRWAIADPQLTESKVVQLWQGMIYAISIQSVYLLYDAPEIASEPRKHWSGSGEVESAFLIGECMAFMKPRRKVHVQRWCDLGKNALNEDWQCFIILGSSIQNKRVQVLQTRDRWEENQRFWFSRVKTKGIDTTGHIRGHIIDRSTMSGKERDVIRYRYKHKSEEHPETDYALVSFIKDKNNRQTLVALQGITTFGTLAAARFMCTEATVRKLYQKLRQQNPKIELSPNKQKVQSFEMVLEIPIEGCVPLEIELETIKIVSLVVHGENTF